MFDQAEKLTLKHMVLFTWRWMPHFQYMKHLLAEEYVGRVLHGHFSFMLSYGRSQSYLWRYDQQRANGIVGDLGSHMIDFARWFVGDIKKVNAHLATHIERPSMDGNALITAPNSALLTLEYDNGAQGTIHVSAVADPVANQYIAIYGEEGTLDVKFAISGPNAGVVIQGRRHDDEAMNILEIPDDIWGQFDDENVMAYFENHAVGPRLFVDSIINDSPVSPNFYDGFKVQEVVDAAFRSHESGSWVSIPQSKSYV